MSSQKEAILILNKYQKLSPNTKEWRRTHSAIQTCRETVQLLPFLPPGRTKMTYISKWAPTITLLGVQWSFQGPDSVHGTQSCDSRHWAEQAAMGWGHISLCPVLCCKHTVGTQTRRLPASPIFGLKLTWAATGKELQTWYGAGRWGIWFTSQSFVTPHGREAKYFHLLSQAEQP